MSEVNISEEFISQSQEVDIINKINNNPNIIQAKDIVY